MLPSNAAEHTPRPPVEPSCLPCRPATTHTRTLSPRDPLNMCGLNLYGMGEEATIGWLRHSEIKVMGSRV